MSSTSAPMWPGIMGLLVSGWCDVRCGLMPIVDGGGDETVRTFNEQREGSNSQDGKRRPQALHR